MRSCHILVLNCGSSSLKFGLFMAGAAAMTTLASGEFVRIGQPGGAFAARDGSGRSITEAAHVIDPAQAIGRVLALFVAWGLPAPDAVGHRLVHGGPKLRRHCLIDRRVMDMLGAAAPFAPLHIPEALAVIGAATTLLPDLPQAGCFDTAFHACLPDVARILPIPRGFEAEGVFRYGFHGLSYESILHQLGEAPPDRLVIAHLGNGASVTAVKAGVSIDTSMGLTPTGGVMMGSRSGDLDPGVLLYLVREKHFDAARLEALVDRESGLLGVSGVGSDLRDLHEAVASNADARLAIDMFAYQLRKQLGAMIAALGGIDWLVFTGGIGENDVLLREKICAGLGGLGVLLDPERNRAAMNPMQAHGSGCSVQVLASQEDEQIARHTRALVAT